MPCLCAQTACSAQDGPSSLYHTITLTSEDVPAHGPPLYPECLMSSEPPPLYLSPQGRLSPFIFIFLVISHPSLSIRLHESESSLYNAPTKSLYLFKFYSIDLIIENDSSRSFFVSFRFTPSGPGGWLVLRPYCRIEQRQLPAVFQHAQHAQHIQRIQHTNVNRFDY